METFYGKRSGLPKNCPDCGAGVYMPRGNDIGEFFKSVYSGWQYRLVKKVPFWNVPKWTAYCANCQMLATLKGPSLLQLVSKEPTPGSKYVSPIILPK